MRKISFAAFIILSSAVLAACSSDPIREAREQAMADNEALIESIPSWCQEPGVYHKMIGLGETYYAACGISESESLATARNEALRNAKLRLIELIKSEISEHTTVESSSSIQDGVSSDLSSRIESIISSHKFGYDNSKIEFSQRPIPGTSKAMFVAFSYIDVSAKRVKELVERE